MIDSIVIRYLAIIAGTVFWDLGAVLQKKEVQAMPAGSLPVTALIGSTRWMGGLLLTAVGWGMFVFGLDRVPVSAARAITGGSYVVLALFSVFLLRAPLSRVEWAALAVVTAGIVLLGVQERPSFAPPVLLASRIVISVACVAVVSAGIFVAALLARRSVGAARLRLFAFAALSGLLGSVGDLLTKVFISLVSASGPGRVPVLVLIAAGLIVFYLTGFYMLSRAYQVGTVVSGVVVSDFFARAGALALGALALSEPVAGAGPGGMARALGFFLVLGGSVLLGRFSGSAPAHGKRGAA